MGKGFIASCIGTMICSLVLAACGNLWGNPNDLAPVFTERNYSVFPTLTPFQPEGFTAASPTSLAVIPEDTIASPKPITVWVSPGVPDMLGRLALNSGLVLASSPETAAVRLFQVDTGISLNSSQISNTTSQSTVWVYALVTPFPTIIDGVTLGDIQQNWSGNPTGPFAGRPLWMEASTLAAFSTLWGAPAPNSIQVVNADQIIDSAWQDRPAWGIIPFEELEPRWKVLNVNGQSPIHNDFNLADYPLKITFNLEPGIIPLMAGNRDPQKLTVLAMTGVTALVRATADKMEKKGILYPGEAIQDVLRQADLTHVSNEIAFDPNCPTPDPWTDSLQFCSDPRYIALLEDIGVDIVELTGNHLLDYGSDDLLTTLDMYDQRGWKYFAGGRNLQDALQPALVENNGNKLAFVGCNFAGPPGDWATENTPGSAPCNLDDMAVEISSLRSQGYLPIMTFQYNEYYQPEPTIEEEDNFRKMSDAGAIIVSGSQAHMPAIMEIRRESFIHYGLGNLFFDQMSHLMPDGSLIYDTRDVFVDRHIFYAGRYIGTELLTYIIEDYARPRPMTDEERSQFLEHIFQVAGW